MECISTKRFSLEPINESHSDAEYKIYSLESVCQYYDISPYTTIEQAEKHIDRWLKFYESGNQVRYAIIYSGKVIGTCRLYLINKNHQRASLGYDLLPEFWGKGYAEKLLMQ